MPRDLHASVNDFYIQIVSVGKIGNLGVCVILEYLREISTTFSSTPCYSRFLKNYVQLLTVR